MDRQREKLTPCLAIRAAPRASAPSARWLREWRPEMRLSYGLPAPVSTYASRAVLGGIQFSSSGSVGLTVKM